MLPLTYDPISVRSPADADATFLAIELLMLLGFGLALAHALRERRRTGRSSALLTLAGCFAYGLVVDITAYYTVDSFRHGEFTVMFLDHRLPLYIALFYPAFLYPVFMTVRRFGLSPRVEAVSVGFYGGVTYLVFDNVGPLLGWWTWDLDADLNKPFVSSVPLTSYQWFFLFTAAFAVVARRVCWERYDGRPAWRTWLEVLAIPLLTYLLGAVVFVPFNVLVANEWYALDAFLYAAVFTAAGFAFLLSRRTVHAPRDPLLLAFPLLWVVGLLYVYVATWDRVGTPGAGPPGNLFAVVLAMVASVAMTLAAHPLERSTDEVDRSEPQVASRA
ncbi:MAG TPA: hypothetical protein VM097_05985 [Mycobacteriales bacterium]|nr:hypothetical protein [Mycobacteriales bacterium]